MQTVGRKPFPKETRVELAGEEGEHRRARKLHLPPIRQLEVWLEQWTSEKGVGSSTPNKFCPAFGISVAK